MSWIISKDYLDVGRDSVEGCGPTNKESVQQIPENEFHLKDDDGQTYYKGYCTNDGSEAMFAPLDWAMSYVGCTEIWYRGKNGKFEIL